MERDKNLTVDQKARIKATLGRIRNGLQKIETKVTSEPVHIFQATEATNVRKS